MEFSKQFDNFTHFGFLIVPLFTSISKDSMNFSIPNLLSEDLLMSILLESPSISFGPLIIP